jgi:hypothetical protein
MRVLIACEYSGIVRDAFVARGHDAMSCDLLPTERVGSHYEGDVFSIAGHSWDLVIAHPPCTRLAHAGLRWLTTPPKGKTKEEMWNALIEGADFYCRLRAAFAHVPRLAIENPRMHRHAVCRTNPGVRHVVQPWWFGDEAFKATGFELRGLPPLVPTNKLAPPKPGTPEHARWSKCHRASPGPDRWKERSRTYPGIAAAMASQWGADETPQLVLS